MEIRILSVGKIKEKYLNDGIGEYTKRLGRYCKLKFIQVPDEKTPDKASEALNTPDQGNRRGAAPEAHPGAGLCDRIGY